MQGTGAKPFEVHGPLWDAKSNGHTGELPVLPLALTGKAGVAWEAARWMALEVGPSELSAELKDSTVYIQPTKIPLSQGTLQLAPVLSLKGQEWLLTHPQARV